MRTRKLKIGVEYALRGVVGPCVFLGMRAQPVLHGLRAGTLPVFVRPDGAAVTPSARDVLRPWADIEAQEEADRVADAQRQQKQRVALARWAQQRAKLHELVPEIPATPHDSPGSLWLGLDTWDAVIARLQTMKENAP